MDYRSEYDWEEFLARSRLEALGYVPADEVDAQSCRESPGGNADNGFSLVLRASSDANEQCASSDAKCYSFTANALFSSVVVWRSECSNDSILKQEDFFTFDSLGDIRTVGELELSRVQTQELPLTCGSPFSREAFEDVSLPLCSLYSLLVERRDPEFIQEVHVFLARSDEHAVYIATSLVRFDEDVVGSGGTKLRLQFTGIDRPTDGLDLFSYTN